MSRFPVTVVRNDGKAESFRRWTVFVGNVAAFDIEASDLRAGAALVHVINGRTGKVCAHFDSRRHLARKR